MRSGEVNMNKLLPFLFVALFLSPIFADGGMSSYNPKTGTWQVSHESRQLAAINYQDGKETMLIAVEPSDLTGSKLVWIFPVPANSSSTKIGLANEFPEFSGTNIERKAGESVQGAAFGLFASQIYLSPLLLGIGLLGFFPGMASNAKSTQLGAVASAGWTPWYTDYVQVRSRLERNGMATELIDTRTSGALFYYLKGKGLDLPYEMQQAIGAYAGKDYCYVVTYINDVSSFKNQSNLASKDQYGNYNYYRSTPVISVSVEFPTDRIYFPLMPTSVYKEKSVPAWIYVMGHVSPEIYSNIQPDTTVEYYAADRYPSSANPSQFYGKYNYASEFKFTKIYINTPSANFVQDLWMADGTPLQVVFTGLLAKASLLISVALFALFSCLSSYLAGTYVFKGTVPARRLALAGLSNFLTTIGFAAVTYHFIKPSAYVGEHCRLKFVALFSVLCLVFALAIFFLGGATGIVSSSSFSGITFWLVLFAGFALLPQAIAAYAYFRIMGMDKSKLIYPLAFALLDIVPLAVIYFMLLLIMRESVLSSIIALIIVVAAEGYFLSVLDKKAFSLERGVHTAAIMKAAAFIAGILLFGILWLMSSLHWYF